MKYLALIVVILMTTCVKLAAQDLSTLIPENVTEAVTQVEVDHFDNYYPNYAIPVNNDEKLMTWDLSEFIHSLILMYETTGNIKYIDYAIICSDTILYAKRTNDIDYVTQRIIPGWAYFFDQFKDSTGNPAIYNNVVGNGVIIRAISRLAWIIQKDKLDETYQLKAKAYINSCTETINNFINHTEWFDSTTKLFHFPDNKRHDDCLPGVRGLTSAYNRQLFMVAGMLNVVKYYDLKADETALRLKYTAIIESVAHYFWNSLTTHSWGYSTYYLWMYREEGSYGSSPRIEDIAHGSADINCIVQIHKDLGIGDGKQLSYMGNTLIEHTQFNPEEHAFANRIDGSSIDENPSLENYNSLKWIALGDYDRRVYTNAGWHLTNGVRLRHSRPYSEFLFYKAKYFGTEFTVPNNAKLDTLSADMGKILPAFSKEIYEYNLFVNSNTTEIYFTAIPVYEEATISGDFSITTIPDTATITVTAEDGVTTQDYVIYILRNDPTEAFLEDLRVDGISVDNFSADNFTYSVEVPFGTTSVDIDATSSDPYASVAGTGAFLLLSGTAELVVSSEDSSKNNTYSIEFTEGPSNIATLSDLSIDGTTIEGFGPDKTTYDLGVAPETTSVEITATTTDINATFTGDGTFIYIPGPAIVTVLAEDGITQLKYTVNITFSTSYTRKQTIEKLNIYPNPVKNKIEFQGNIDKLKSCTILDYSGKTIKNSLPVSGSINVEDLKPSIYILKLNFESHIQTIKFIKID